jgi:GNAT superfamily N-acetyltransferase
MRIRPLDPASDEEIALVADRMRRTLVEVLGEARGTAMYTTDWLRARVRFHLVPDREVLLAEDGDGVVIGHTIVRVEPDEGPATGLFSTTFVAPEARRAGVASALLAAGEGWMRDRAMASAVTWTGDANTKLLRLYERHGYAVTARTDEMVRLSRAL